MRWWDKSWNPITGCVPCSEGCDNCISIANLKKQGRSCDPQISKVSLEKELFPSMNYLVCSLGDMFDFEDHRQIDHVFEKMINMQDSQFFICTKKTSMLMEYMEHAKWRSNDMNNIWFGCSVESQDYVDRVDELCGTVEISHRFVQIEPMLGPIEIGRAHV